MMSIKYLLEQKCARYNRARGKCEVRKELELYNQLVGMKELLEAMGFYMSMDTNELGELSCTVEI